MPTFIYFVIVFILYLVPFIYLSWKSFEAIKKAKESKQNLINTIEDCIEKIEHLILESRDREVKMIKEGRLFPWNQRIKDNLEVERKYQKELLDSQKESKERLEELLEKSKK